MVGPPCTGPELRCSAKRAGPRSKRLMLLHRQRDAAEPWWIWVDTDQREDGARFAASQDLEKVLQVRGDRFRSHTGGALS